MVYTGNEIYVLNNSEFKPRTHLKEEHDHREWIKVAEPRLNFESTTQ